MLVVGWYEQRNVPLRYLTHACVASVGNVAEVAVDDGLDLTSEQPRRVAEMAEPEMVEAELGSRGRRSSWIRPWQLAREVGQLAAEVARLTERLAVAEREIAELRSIVDAAHETPIGILTSE